MISTGSITGMGGSITGMGDSITGLMLPLAAADGGERLADFGQDPWWVVLVKALLIFVILVLATLFNIWFLRRVMGRMQHRIGPNVNGPAGLLQTLADGVKLALKEDLNVKAADKVVFFLAPVLMVIPAFVTWSVIPFGPVVNFFGVQTPLQLTDMPVGVLFVLAIASISVYGLVLGGWSSGSTYSLLGGIRSSAQMISYEVPMGLSLVAVFLYAGSMSTSEIVAAQSDLWFAIALLPSFLIFFISVVGETNNIPFDLPEAEGELVGGYMTEYSSLKFALFFLAEFINKVTAAALIVTLFLGGWRAPWPISLWEGANQGYWPVLWFFAKVYLFVFIFAWLMGTLPRTRYDQLMDFGWKFLIPVSLVWIVAVATVRAVRLDESVDTRTLMIGLAAVFVVLMGGLFLYDLVSGRRKSEAEAEEEEATAPADAFAGGFPVPPMPQGGAVQGRAAPLTYSSSTRPAEEM